MKIVANWKAYVQSLEKAKKLFALAKRIGSLKGVEIIIAPPLPYIAVFAKNNRSKVRVGAQDVSSVTSGAETGEVSAALLADSGAEYVIVGHSERRARGETDAMVAEKIQRVLANGLTPILCVGETTRDEHGAYLQFLRSQITSALASLTPKERAEIMLAYEPVWAIGKTAADAIASSDLAEMVLYIRKVLGEFLPGKASLSIPVLYGGSVEADNARALAGASGIDGFLVGHASVEPAIFSALVKSLARA